MLPDPRATTGTTESVVAPFHIRQRALELANNADLSPESVVKRAEAFLAFLQGV